MELVTIDLSTHSPPKWSHWTKTLTHCRNWPSSSSYSFYSYTLLGYAFLAAVFLINWLPTVTLSGKVAYTVLHGMCPNYDSLRVFGYTFPNLQLYATNKLEFWYATCTFLGYSALDKGFHCLHPNSRVYISHDVRIDENYFPFSKAVEPSSPVPFDSWAFCYPTNLLSNLPTYITLSSFFPCSFPSLAWNLTWTYALPCSFPSFTCSSPPCELPPLHPMMTRAKNGIFKPKTYLTKSEPKNVKFALASP